MTRIAALIATCLVLTGCPGRLNPDALVTASCPPLTPLADPTFGATTLKLLEVAGQYNVCRCAAVPAACK